MPVVSCRSSLKVLTKDQSAGVTVYVWTDLLLQACRFAILGYARYDGKQSNGAETNHMAFRLKQLAFCELWVESKFFLHYNKLVSVRIRMLYTATVITVR